MKHVKNIGSLVKDSKKINYHSKSFMKGLNNVKEKIREDNEMSIPNHEKSIYRMIFDLII
jgi:hypothetical protein